MSNTLNLGGGKWATKEGSLLAYNSENNNYKPLPFTFDRASSATRVNKDGLIETVGADQPRVDYLNDSNGALLLEPSRSNLIQYSEDFTQWGNAGTPTVVLSSSLAPNGSLDAYDITDDSTGIYEIKRSNSASFDGTYTMSIFVKKTTGALTHYPGIQFIGLSDYLIINTTNGTVNQTASEYSNIKVEDFSNWWKISATGTNTGSTFLINIWAAISSNGTSLSPNTTGTNTFYGAQLEQGSYATSYIPTTSGSAVTRSADSCSQTVPDGVIGQTEGVVYVEANVNDIDLGNNRISLSDGGTSNWLFFSVQEFTGSGAKARVYIGNGANIVTVYVDSVGSGFHKYALSYKVGEAKFYIDGMLKATLNPISIPNCSVLNLTGSSPANTNTDNTVSFNEVKLYNTALTDQELIALTT